MGKIEYQEAYDKIAEAYETFAQAVKDVYEQIIEIFTKVFRETIHSIVDLVDKLVNYLHKQEKDDSHFWYLVKKRRQDYLHNQQISAYKVNRKIQKNLPYQLRNY